MKCPSCRNTWLKVLETRHTTEDTISRRRQCKICDHVFATAEVIVPDNAIAWKPEKRSATVTKAQFGVKVSVLEALNQKSAEAASIASNSMIRPTA